MNRLAEVGWLIAWMLGDGRWAVNGQSVSLMSEVLVVSFRLAVVENQMAFSPSFTSVME